MKEILSTLRSNIELIKQTISSNKLEKLAWKGDEDITLELLLQSSEDEINNMIIIIDRLKQDDIVPGREITDNDHYVVNEHRESDLCMCVVCS
jgi:hypothetical protein